MRKARVLSAAAFLGAVVVAALSAQADRGDRPRGSLAALLAPILEPQQSELVRNIFSSDQAELALLRLRLRLARRALITRLFSPEKRVDVTKEAAELKAAQAAFIDRRVALALKARRVLTPEQRAKALRLWQQWRNLRDQERSLRERAGTPQAPALPDFTLP
ncbi:MAG: hypothetical protein M1336_04940 [Deltaproteobacteria bacterium]|jgi:Spy/CpxP family protein refolding chaperone|nr:hypothetical protein [Deltaproteobacteria bacterium]